MPSPRQIFEDNIRPAELLVHVYRLLENDEVLTCGDLVSALRGLVGAKADEDLMLVCNEIFVGLVRERADFPRPMLKRGALGNLLRQAVVASCTALDTYLPALLRLNLPAVIKAKGRAFLPTNKEVAGYFQGLTLSLDDYVRLLGNADEAGTFITNKILGFIEYRYLSTSKGVLVTGSLLGIEKPWQRIAERLRRDAAECEKIVKDTTDRRNDIVHRADRKQRDPDGDAQEVSYSWTRQAVDTIKHVCLALDELVAAAMGELKGDAR